MRRTSSMIRPPLIQGRGMADTGDAARSSRRPSWTSTGWLRADARRGWFWLGAGTLRSPASAASPYPCTHSGSGPSVGRPVKNFVAMQRPRQKSKK